MAIITMISDPAVITASLAGLAPQGRLVVLGAGKDPLPVSAGFLVSGERSVLGSITGSPYENEKTLNFSVLTGARPLIETLPLERANEAYQRMHSGEVKFRMVLTMNSQH
jgi:alcohol dehydrogenase